MDNIQIRKLWISDKDRYDQIGKNYVELIREALKKDCRGVPIDIKYRVKDIDSLIKKIHRKNVDYDSIHDKVGIRIIVNFKQDLEYMDNAIKSNFSSLIKKREDMTEKLGESTFGYQSIHYDLCQTIDNDEYYCEIQLRTVCQDTWSILSHTLSYKKDMNIPMDIKREINALSAVLELADNQFQHVRNLIEDLPQDSPIKLLMFLEEYFYQIGGKKYDNELSLYFLKNISRLYDNDNIENAIKIFVSEKQIDITKVVSEMGDNIFFTQPEILIILERLQNKTYLMKEYWDEIYPPDDLEDIANAWGISIE